jgi:hypothetical protein
MESAKWDCAQKALVDCGQKELISVLPIVDLIPTAEELSARDFLCPLYLIQNRGTGALDLPNHLMNPSILAPAPDHWIQRSVAVFVIIQA